VTERFVLFTCVIILVSPAKPCSTPSLRLFQRATQDRHQSVSRTRPLCASTWPMATKALIAVNAIASNAKLHRFRRRFGHDKRNTGPDPGGGNCYPTAAWLPACVTGESFLRTSFLRPARRDASVLDDRASTASRRTYIRFGCALQVRWSRRCHHEASSCRPHQRDQHPRHGWHPLQQDETIRVNCSLSRQKPRSYFDRIISALG